MHAAMVEAVPAGTLAALAEAAKERLAAVRVEHVMLARHEEHRQPKLFQHLLGVIELLIAGELRDVAGVNDEIGPVRQRLHLGDGFAEGSTSVGIGWLVEADVAVADLRKRERLGDHVLGGRGKRCVESYRAADPAFKSEQGAGARPRHALEKSAAVVLWVVEHRSS